MKNTAMRIKIEVNEATKYAIANIFNIELNDKTDLRYTCEGKFGSLIYDPEGYIEIELNFGSVLDILSMFNSFISLAAVFGLKHLKGVVEKMFDKDGDEVVRKYNEDYTDFEIIKKKELEKNDVKTTEATEEEVKEA